MTTRPSLSAALRRLDGFLKGAGAQGHLTRVALVLTDVTRPAGQVAAHLEGLVGLPGHGAGAHRGAVGERTSVHQPADLCEADRHAVHQAEQRGVQAGREPGGAVERQDGRRQAGAYRGHDGRC